MALQQLTGGEDGTSARGIINAGLAATDANTAAIAAESAARATASQSEAQARIAADQAEAQARAQGDQAEAQARATGDQANAQAVATEAQARTSADQAEAQARANGDQANALAVVAEARFRAAADQAEAQARAQGDQAATDAIGAEARARAAGDQAEALARAQGDQASADAVAAEALARVTGDQALQQATEQLVDGVRSDLAASEAATRDIVSGQRLEFVAHPGRPGDAPTRYTFVASVAALAGPRSALPLIAAGLLAVGDNGAVVRISGSGFLGARAARAIEPGRLYRSRYVVQRRANPSNPTGDAVVCGLVFLDQSLRLIGDVAAVKTYPALITAFGRQECEALISRAAGMGALFQPPPAARFMAAVVALYGSDALTDIEVLAIDDVTNAVVLAPPVEDFNARLTALEAADLLARLDRIEQQLGSPSKLTFGSKGDAAYATIPPSVQVVELLGRRYAGDGGAGLYARISGDPPNGADLFVSHGAVFQRVQVLPDVAASMIDTGFESFMAGLPTDAPPTSGGRWNDRGIPAVTP